MALLSSNSALGSMAKKLGVDLTKSTLLSGTSTTTSSKSSGGSSKKKSSSGGSSAVSQPSYSNEQLLSGYIDLFYGSYKPEKLVYTKRTADELSTEIAAWLRPAYDAAIAEREKLTDTYRAELDADAIARGMGASSYVTDVKSRQMQREAEDIALYESDYAAQLAQQMSAALEIEQQRAFETDLFNAEAENEAYQKAYNMALTMLQAYHGGDAAAIRMANSMFGSTSSGGASSGSGKTSSGGSGGSASGSTASGAVGATSQENCETFLAGLTAEERKNIYSSATEEDAAYRSELIASVGTAGYLQLMQKYPSR